MGEGSNQFGRVGGYSKTSIEAGLGQSDKASKSLFQILTFRKPRVDATGKAKDISTAPHGLD